MATAELGPLGSALANEALERELDVRAGLGLFASEQELRGLLAIARQVELRPGAVLYEEGQVVQRGFQLTRGELELRAEGHPTWRMDHRGAMGFLDFMRGRTHARTASEAVARNASAIGRREVGR